MALKLSILCIVYAHPLLIVQLCVLFNVMLQYGIVPGNFCEGIIIPILKDNTGRKPGTGCAIVRSRACARTIVFYVLAPAD